MNKLCCIILLNFMTLVPQISYAECNKQEKYAATNDAAELHDWGAVYTWFKKYAHCGSPSGEAAESLQDAVAVLLAKKWSTFSRLTSYIERNKNFKGFVISQIGATADSDDLRRARENALKHCPAKNEMLCAEIAHGLDVVINEIEDPYSQSINHKKLQESGAEKIRSKLNEMIDEAEKSCPTCYLPVSDKPIDFPLAKVPNDFLVTGEIKSLRQIDGEYAVLLNMLRKEKVGWKLVHPVSEIGIQEAFIEFISGAMRLTCTEAGMIAEYIIKPDEKEFDEFSDAFLLAKTNSEKIQRLFILEQGDVKVAHDFEKESLRQIGDFTNLRGDLPNIHALKRVIISKSFPCSATFAGLASVPGRNANPDFH